MGKARTIALESYIKRHGIKKSWLAAALDMDEALLRYRIKNGLTDSDFVEQIKALLKAHALALLEDLEEIQS